MTEVWRAVPGYEGLYEVSNIGRFRSVKRPGRQYGKTGVIHTLNVAESGHLRVRLRKDGVKKFTGVHRLVLAAFVGPCPEGMEGCHNNGDPADNRVENLRWDTPSSNNYDRVRHGTHPNASKSQCVNGHKFVDQNLVNWAKVRGNRQCLACARARAVLQKRPHLDFQTVADRKFEAIMASA